MASFFTAKDAKIAKLTKFFQFFAFFALFAVRSLSHLNSYFLVTLWVGCFFSNVLRFREMKRKRIFPRQPVWRFPVTLRVPLPQNLVRGAGATFVAGSGAVSHQAAQFAQHGRADAIPRMFHIFGVQRAAPGFGVNGRSAKIAFSAPDNLQTNLVKTAVRRQFYSLSNSQRRRAALRANKTHTVINRHQPPATSNQPPATSHQQPATSP